MPELLHRAFTVRSVDQGTREVTGIAVPWDAEIAVYGYRESIARGAVETIDNPKLFAEHRAAIGKLTAWRDTDEGWEITARISETPLGDEFYTLLRDGVIDRMSIGFEPVEQTETVAADGSVVVRRTLIRVYEVSLVPFPAYDGAAISAVRSATHTEEITVPPTDTDTITRADLDAINTDLDKLTRGLALLAAESGRHDVPTAPVFRSIGEMVKRIAEGDEVAKRAYEGAVSGDTVMKDAWVGSLVEIVKKRRPMFETFATGPLPADGLGVEFAVLESDTTQAGVQANEGDDLLFGKVSLTSKTAPVVTIGGWTQMSRQAIERASVPFLDTAWEALTERYGRASEVYVRSVFNAALAAAGAAALAEVEADLTTQDGIVAAVLDLAEHFEDVGRSLDGLWVDKATFLAIYGVEATDRVLQVQGSPLDKVGTITVKSGQGEVAGLPFKVLPGAAANTVVAYDATAIKTLEAGGAPYRLQDDNIVNLSRDFSLYGYVSGAVQKPAGLVKVVAGV